MADPALTRPAKPVSLGALPSCSEPAPYDRDDRLIWMLRCSIQKQLSAAALVRLQAMLDSIDDWSLSERAEAAAGLASGLARGAKGAARDAVDDLAQLVIKAARVIAGEYGAAFDPSVWQGIEQVLRLDPGPQTQQAAAAVVAVAGKDHPDFIDALMTAGMVSEAFRKVVAWVQAEPNAPYIVLLSVTAHIGELLGEIAAEIAAADTPFDFCKVIGELLGQLLVAAIRFYFGI